jgi:hypothetical protein
LRRAGLGRSGLGEKLHPNGRLFAHRIIDVTASFRLTRGGFQGALASRELALGKIKIACSAAARTAGAHGRRRWPLAAA